MSRETRGDRAVGQAARSTAPPGRRREARKRLEVALPEAERLPPRRGRQRQREPALRVGPARSDRLDHAVRARRLRRAARGRRRRSRTPRSGSGHRRPRARQPDVHAGALQPLEVDARASPTHTSSGRLRPARSSAPGSSPPGRTRRRRRRSGRSGPEGSENVQKLRSMRPGDDGRALHRSPVRVA